MLQLAARPPEWSAAEGGSCQGQEAHDTELLLAVLLLLLLKVVTVVLLL